MIRSFARFRSRLVFNERTVYAQRTDGAEADDAGDVRAVYDEGRCRTQYGVGEAAGVGAGQSL